jgi:hypothetical protein
MIGDVGGVIFGLDCTLGTMMKLYITAVMVTAIGVSGCATKRYPVATPPSTASLALMDCRDLEREMLDASQMQAQIADTAQTDWRSLAAVWADFGIGNAMAKSEAQAALTHRMVGLQGAFVERGCGSAVVAQRTSASRSYYTPYNPSDAQPIEVSVAY